jgi:hypothetical protein
MGWFASPFGVVTMVARKTTVKHGQRRPRIATRRGDRGHAGGAEIGTTA